MILGTFFLLLLPIVGLLLSLWLAALSVRYLAGAALMSEKPSGHRWTSLAAAFAIGTALLEAGAHLLWLLHALHWQLMP
jgi:hypothetical protein